MQHPGPQPASLYEDVKLEDEEVERLRQSHSALEARLSAAESGERVACARASASAETVEVLEANISSLFTTAKLELLRKDTELDRLRSLLDRERTALALTQAAMQAHLGAQDSACCALRAALEHAGLLQPSGAPTPAAAAAPHALAPLAEAASQWVALVTGAVQRWGSSSSSSSAPGAATTTAPHSQLPVVQSHQGSKGEEEGRRGGGGSDSHPRRHEAERGGRDWSDGGRARQDSRGAAGGYSEGRGRDDRDAGGREDYSRRRHESSRRSRSRSFDAGRARPDSRGAGGGERRGGDGRDTGGREDHSRRRHESSRRSRSRSRGRERQ